MFPRLSRAMKVHILDHEKSSIHLTMQTWEMLILMLKSRSVGSSERQG